MTIQANSDGQVGRDKRQSDEQIIQPTLQSGKGLGGELAHKWPDVHQLRGC